MDEHVPAAITRGLVMRGVDVLTAQLDDATLLADPGLLDRATNLGHVLFSQDADLLAEATKHQRSGATFGGVIYAPKRPLPLAKQSMICKSSPMPATPKTSRIGLNIFLCH